MTETYFKDDRLVYDNAEYLDIYVMRAAKDGNWIDVFCYDNHTRTSWSKRMKLPLPEKWTKVPRR